MTKTQSKRFWFFMKYCFPVIFGISVIGFFGNGNLCAFGLSVLLSSAIVYGLLVIFE